MVQGTLWPQELCAKFRLQDRIPIGPLTQADGTPIPGANWQMAIVFHRWSVRFVIERPVAGINDPGEFIEHLRNVGIDMLKTWLHAQSLYSNERLEMDTYTVTFSHEGKDLETMWVQLVPKPSKEPIPIEALLNGTETVLPAVWDLDFRRALRDYDLALTFNEENRLVFLWRAAEEILRHYHTPKEGASPGYEPGARALKLHYSDDVECIQWMRELGTLSHKFARHSGKRQLGLLPDSFDKCVEAAQLRVAEMIRRHAKNIDDRFPDKAFLHPQPDILTGWLKPDTGTIS